MTRAIPAIRRCAAWISSRLGAVRRQRGTPSGVSPAPPSRGRGNGWTASRTRRSSGSPSTACSRWIFARPERPRTPPARFFRRRSSSSPSLSRCARCASIFSESSGTFSSRAALVRTSAAARIASVEGEDRADLVQHCPRGRVVDLVDRDHVRNLHYPRLQRRTESSDPGMSMRTTVSAIPITSISLWPAPTVSTKASPFLPRPARAWPEGWSRPPCPRRPGCPSSG